MPSSPLISVVVPVYNNAVYLRQCFDSIVNQTYKNLEIILINDGSTDNSLSIMKEYAAKDKRIIIINCSKNLGVSAIRNLGIDRARGEYFIVPDSDDYLKLETIAAVHKIISQKQCDFGVFGYCELDQVSGKITKKVLLSKITHRPYLIKDHANGNNLIFAGVPTGMPFKLFRRDFLIAHNLRFKENLRYSEDALFWIECLLAAQKVAYINQAFYIRRINTGHQSRTSAAYHYLDNIFVQKQAAKLIIQKGLMSKLKSQFIKFCIDEVNYYYYDIMQTQISAFHALSGKK